MLQPTVAIIGAGFSGAILSLRLRPVVPPDTRILLIERSGQFGPGLAYGAAGPDHLLNVPAGRMSPFPAAPDHFLQWARRRRPHKAIAGADFLPRRLYGEYLQQLLDAAADAPCPRRLADEVVAIDAGQDGVVLRLASGGVVAASVAVLATGNARPLPPHPALASLRAGGLWMDDPWAPDALSGIAPAAPVLLIGTGLTMVDVVTTLLGAGHAGPIHALSRRGLLPRPHAAAHAPFVPNCPPPGNLPGLFHWLRREADRAAEGGGGWQGVMDALRPTIQDLWRGFSDAERRCFLRHARPYWDVHRHRLPRRVAERIAAAQDSGQLRIMAGRVVDVAEAEGSAVVTWRPRRQDAAKTLRVARVVNCTGAATDITRGDDLLMRGLLAKGTIRPDPCRQGVDVALNGAVRNRFGIASPHVYAIGPLTKGAWWEVTSVPDIRQQCETLAKTIGERLSAAAATGGGVPLRGNLRSEAIDRAGPAIS
ncbi:MAG TPA: FAD/NAD(P)-binding protein [Rhodopila sp.]|uniref:FAD/NAD(P)-binding protein n=1 Tax=Rhodopila sp. TaxID=2480087 RepID=UPI002CE2FDBD|nr:FAD/NAD(P)-binding protein [Rhodopila sp.]HVY16290.1 FAD/NAD(P)-binding protein [Rhodopila sp.]